jgi:hypothetical protein
MKREQKVKFIGSLNGSGFWKLFTLYLIIFVSIFNPKLMNPSGFKALVLEQKFGTQLQKISTQILKK